MKQSRKYKIAISLTFIMVDVFTMIIIALTLSRVFNYPPLSENNVFQLQIESFTHLQQYIVMGILVVIIHLILARVLFRKIYKFLDEYDKKEIIPYNDILKIRKMCISFPYYLLLLQTLIATAIIVFLAVLLTDNIYFTIRISLYVFSIAYFVSLLLMSIVQILLRKVLRLTYYDNKYDKDVGLRLNFSTNITTQVIPFLAVAIISITLISYNFTIQKNSDISFKYYKEKLDNIKLEQYRVNQQYLIQKLDEIELYNLNDYYFITSADTTYFSKEWKSNSKFFNVYLDMYYEQMEGKIFEYYGVEEEGYVKKVTDSTGKEWIIGVKYSITDIGLIVFYNYVIVVALLFYTILLTIWSKNMGRNIKNVSQGLKDILQDQEIDKNKILPIMSNDEVRRFIILLQ